METLEAQVEALKDILTSLGGELFHSPEGIAYIDIYEHGCRRTYQIDDPSFSEWLYYQFYTRFSKILRSSILKTFLTFLRAEAIFGSKERNIDFRVAAHQDRIYIDLECPDGTVEIDSQGWRLVKDAPARFQRSKNSRPLPLPETGGSLEELSHLINIGLADWALIGAWLVCSLSPTHPHPILVLQGEGADKSAFAQVLKSLIDPVKKFEWLYPRTNRDLSSAVSDNWVLAFEQVPPKLFNAVVAVPRPIILSSAEELIACPELLDRSFYVSLSSIFPERYQRGREFFSKYEELRPRILAVLLDAVSLALQKQNEIKLEGLPWMTEFLVWADAAEPVLGLEAGAILQAYNLSRVAIQSQALESSPLAMVIWEMLMKLGFWEGTASQLLIEIQNGIQELGFKNGELPTAPTKLSSTLRKLTPNLASAGISVNFARKGHGGTRLIQLKKIKMQPKVNRASTLIMQSTVPDAC